MKWDFLKLLIFHHMTCQSRAKSKLSGQLLQYVLPPSLILKLRPPTTLHVLAPTTRLQRRHQSLP